MGLLLRGTDLRPWHHFVDRCAEYGAISVVDAVALLRSVFGPARPVLLCVDELAVNKMPQCQAVMQELCDLLDSDRNVDVLITALTFPFVEEALAHTPYRPHYLVVEPIRGRIKEYDEAVEAILQRARAHAQTQPLDERCVRVLREAYLLASGHGRTMDYLVEEMVYYGMGDVEEGLALGAFTPQSLLFYLSAFGVFRQFSQVPTSAQDAALVFSAQGYRPERSTLLRDGIESGHCNLHSQSEAGVFRVVACASIVFETAFAAVRSFDPHTLPAELRAVHDLFAEPNLEMTELWPRLRLLSIFARCQTAGANGDSDLLEAVGVEAKGLPMVSVLGRITHVHTRRCSRPVESHPAPHQFGHAYACDFEAQWGWSILLCGRDASGQPACVYEHAMLNAPVQYAQHIASVIRLILCDHFAHRGVHSTGSAEATDRSPHKSKSDAISATAAEGEDEEFERIVIIFSCYGEAGEVDQLVSDPDAEEMLRHMRSEEQRLSESTLDEVAQGATQVKHQQLEEDWGRAVRYVTQVWGRNVKFVDRRRLEETMIPTTLPLAELLSRVMLTEK